MNPPVAELAHFNFGERLKNDDFELESFKEAFIKDSQQKFVLISCEALARHALPNASSVEEGRVKYLQKLLQTMPSNAEIVPVFSVRIPTI